MDAVLPSISNAFTCSGSREISSLLAIADVAGLSRDLPVRAEFDPIRRVQVNALHLPLHPLALRHGGHDLERVAQDHPVRPVLIVLVELGARLGFEAVEIREQVGCLVFRRPGAGRGAGRL